MRIRSIAFLLLLLLAIPTAVSGDTELPFDTTRTGTISTEDSEDAYTINVPEAGTITINLKVYFSAAMYEFRDSNNKLIGDWDVISHGRPENPTVESKSLHVEPGKYTLFVKDFGSYGNYEVSVNFKPANNTEREPNQNFTEAMPLSPTNGQVRGLISKNDWRDFYKVEITEPGRLYFDVVSHMNFGNFNFYDATGQRIKWDDFGWNNGLMVPWKRHFDLERGTYYFEVSGNDFYQGIYDLGLSFTPAKNEEREPNNRAADAIPLALNDSKTHRGFMSVLDPADYYKFEMMYDGYLTINYTSEFALYTILDKTETTHYHSYMSRGLHENPVLSTEKVFLPKGTYYFQVMNGGLYHTGVYTMSFKVEVPFKDVTARYQDAVGYLVENGVTKGMSRDQFGVTTSMKRADAAIWLAKILGLDVSNTAPTQFSDVPPRATGAVNALQQAKIMNGKSASTFGSHDTMTRGEMALVLKRAYKLSGDSAPLPFTDVAPRYEEAVSALVKNKITLGKTATSFGTNAPVTRGEMALFLYRAK